ncbi:MAG TPA: RNA polymerase sigma factor [bacterium]|nr:RNA polymerase sigma factor [bacterium]
MKTKQFDNILQDHKDRVYSYSLYLLKNREDAEDVTQEVFVRFWENQEKVNRKKVLSWLLTVTHHRCIDLLRQKRASVSRQRMTCLMEVDHLAANTDCCWNPEKHLEDSETREKLINAMDKLPDKTRSILLLHYYQGFKYEDISKMLDSKVSTVKVAVHRGKRILKDALTQSFPERTVI